MKLTTIKSALISALVASTSFVVESTPDDNDIIKIVGGETAIINNYPYFAQMVWGCAGTLIAPDIVLSAAHCGDWSGEDEYVVVGAHRISITNPVMTEGSELRTCSEWIPDPMYELTPDSAFHDFALCKLNKPVDLSNSNIRLEMNADSSVPSDGDALIAMGFGTISTEYFQVPLFLQDVEIPYVTNEICNAASSYNGLIEDVMLCAGEAGVDTCQGDSGGPLVKRTISNDGTTIVDTLVGVTSWGLGCGDANYPGVYSRVSERLDWIKNTACTDLQSVAPFCSTDSPTKSPTKVTAISLSSDCDDNIEFRAKENDDNSCELYISGGGKRKERRCKERWGSNDAFVYEWCPATCGKVNEGKCANGSRRKRNKRKKSAKKRN